MRILNFGSLNIDHVYRVDHFVQPGETLSSLDYCQFAGGKGNNQSIALARAGAEVYHAGKIGKDGLFLKEELEKSGANTDFIEVIDTVTGHAIIQVDKNGENAIIIHGGANREITPGYGAKIMDHFSGDDFLLLQNEISAIPEIMNVAAEKGMTIVFNPAPMGPEIPDYPLDLVDYFIVNEVEGEQLTGKKNSDDIISEMLIRYPESGIILTLGADGVKFADKNKTVSAPGEKVVPVDTTAAGDTFIGYFLANIAQGNEIEESLKIACKAAAISVTRPGAVSSIPSKEELV